MTPVRAQRNLAGPRPVVAALVAVAVFVLTVRLQPGGSRVARAVDDLGQLGAAAVAAGICGWRAGRSAPRAAWSWWLLAAGSGAWACGQTLWSYDELLVGRETPFPSPADAGFLLFPVLAVMGLLCWPSAALYGAARWRALLDGTLVAGALFIVSWVTVLGATLHAHGTDEPGYAVSLAYPILDLILLTLTIVVVSHVRTAGRSGLGLLAVGLGCLALADSGFAYLTAHDRYATGSPVDAGWFGGFLLIAAAAASARSTGYTAVRAELESTARAMLPYVPAGVGLAVAMIGQFTGGGDRVALAAAAVVMTALLCRQLLAMLDNRALLRQIVDAQHELRHQAFHDPLTGLANRALFADRLRHGLALHARDLRPLGLLYCDLDSFKTVNDTLGHDAGDAVLRAAAERLRAVTRAGDTVARMGGDEFAMLLEDGANAGEVAAKVLAAFSEPASFGRHRVPLATSIGIVELDADDTPVSPEVLLQRADSAMYQAKRNGKGSAVTWSRQAFDRVPGAPADQR